MFVHSERSRAIVVNEVGAADDRPRARAAELRDQPYAVGVLGLGAQALVRVANRVVRGRVDHPRVRAGVVRLDDNLAAVLDKGCWSEQQYLGRHWHAELINADGSAFNVFYQDEQVGTVNWSLLGQHNVDNALMAIAAAHHAGVTLPDAIAALSEFVNVKRRMEVRGCVKDITVYDDFAHHPTAIKTTLDGLRKKVGDARIIGVLEPRSNTMKMGIHKDVLVDSWQEADEVLLFEPDNLGWSMAQLAKHSRTPTQVFRSVDAIIHQLATMLQPGDHVLIMSNGGFGGIHNKLLDVLAGKA